MEEQYPRTTKIKYFFNSAIINMQTIEIPVSKRKLVLSLLGCVAFVVAGVFFICSPETFKGRAVTRPPAMVITVGVLSVLFFGMCGYFVFKKLIVKAAGLIINEKGIADNSSGLSNYMILWNDIEEIGAMKMFRQNFVTIQVKNPQEYIDYEKRPAVRKNMEVNLRHAGTPFCISTNALDIKFKKLLVLLQQKLQESRTPQLS